MGKFSDWLTSRLTTTKAPGTAQLALDLATMFPAGGSSVNMDGLGQITGITREMALQHPVIVRTLNKQLSVGTALPLVQFGEDGLRVTGYRQRRWSEPAGLRYTRRTLIKRTIEDLYFDGKSLWTVERRFPQSGLPETFRHWEFGTWSLEPHADPAKRKWKVFDPDTNRHLFYDLADGIYFEGLDNGILHTGGAHALITGLRAQRALQQSVDTPVPLGYFSSPDGPLEKDQIAEIFTSFAAARREGRNAVIPYGLAWNQTGMTPRDRQVLDAAAHADMGLARATAGSAEDVFISTTSRTYTNMQDARTDNLRHDTMRYLGPIEDRLSMSDIVGRDRVRFDLNEYTRGSEEDRFRAYKIGLEVGVYADEDAVREAEGLPPLTAAQKRARMKKAAPAPATSEPGAPPAQTDKTPGKEAPTK